MIFYVSRISHIWLHMRLSFDSFSLSRRCSFFLSSPPYSSSYSYFPLPLLALFVCSFCKLRWVCCLWLCLCLCASSSSSCSLFVAYWRFYLFSVFCAFSYMLKNSRILFAKLVSVFVSFLLFFFFELLVHLHVPLSLSLSLCDRLALLLIFINKPLCVQQ